ncbi:hypothetical protein HOLleu_18605 [Holothuria leucospilota]|uniref:Integrase catalytic domain-containing protein n=1 Tax=Holothuria leucospilota TaxID=206669 RepID=A0A9Q1C425_HOLLE|nr:hypothetical protein HOLleu_18605 [Holothuria leucospilota]
MEALKTERANCLRSLTRLKNEISGLVKEETINMEKIEEKVALYEKSYKDFSNAHEEYVSKLEEKQATEENKNYFQPKFEEYQQFSKEISDWMKGMGEDVKPQDSISQVSSNTSKASRASSVRSKASTARMKEEAKLAELRAKAELIKIKREIEEHERRLQRQKEDYELEVEMKLTEAKANVYKRYQGPDENHYEGLPIKQSGVHDLIQTQSEISKMMINQQKLVSLPRRDIQIFDGKVQDYRAFIAAFEHNIEKFTENDQDRLYYLQQYTSGRPREMVRSCMGKDRNRGYDQARKELEEEYGDDFKIISSYRKEIEMMKSIKGDDTMAMKDYLTFCVVYSNAIKESDILRKMDQTESIMKLVSKLPYRMRERWRTQAHKIKEKSHRLANLNDYVEFVREQVKIATDSVYGDISVENSKENSKFRQNRKFSKGFSTVVLEEKSNSKISEKASDDAKCLYCGFNHRLEVCRKLGAKSHEEKLAFLRSKGLCFRCLEGNHVSKDCKQDRLICETCQKPHPTVLHYNRKPEQKSSKDSSEEQTSKETAKQVKVSCTSTQIQESSICMGAGVSKTSLSIVPVRVKSKSTNKDVETYAFLDNGSTDTFISEDLAHQLSVSGPKTKIMLSTLQQEELVDSRAITNLEVCDLEGHNTLLLPKVFTQKRIPACKDDIVTQDDLKKWPYLSRVSLPNSRAMEVGILIGNNVHKAMEPWDVINSQDDGPHAIRTCLGWVVNGPVIGGKKAHVNYITLQTIDDMLTSQFNHDFNERISDEKLEKSRDDHLFLHQLEKSTKMVNGHYETALPLKDENVCMPNNKALATQWANNMKQRFLKDSKYLEDYKGFMKGLLDKGYAVQITDEELRRDDGKVWYIPHHGVYHPQKGKIRVVFNCAAKFQGISLNDRLLQGPDLTNSLVGVLLRFRLEQIALMADIEAMFYQVQVQKDHCDLLRFLWWPDGNIEGPLREYKMVVHLFGAVSSPSCANYALHRTADDFGNDFDTETVGTVKENFYVDDMLKSVRCEEEAVRLVRQMRELTGKGGFHLTKWVSNSRAVLNAIPESERAERVKSLDMDKDKLPVDRALGVMWCVESDQFQFRVTVNQRPYTRKGILSIMASVYDPLGFLAPFVLVAKRILQDLCKIKLAWDDDIPNEHLTCWKRWLAELPKLKDFEVNRCFKPEEFGKIKETQIHLFSDASETGYGVAAYVRYENEEGRTHCTLVMGKARVAPLKQVTIPRLELTAATVSVKLYKSLERELPMKPDKVKFWTDSTAVIRYISNSSARYHTFVANRVATIIDASQPNQWSYVESSENPADDASRGLYADDLIQRHRWTNGPDFLWLPENKWPASQRCVEELSMNDPEIKKKATVAATSLTSDQTTMTKLISNSSSWFKLRCHIAWMLKLMTVFKQLSGLRKSLDGQDPKEVSEKMRQERQRKLNMKLTMADMKEAELVIVKFVQRPAFSDEIAAIRNNSKGRPVKKTSSIYKLDPKYEDGVLRVGGRLSRSAMPEGEKHPYILPKDSTVSEMIIRETHIQLYHGGRALTLSHLRRKYWIVSAPALVRKCINRCVTCRRFRGKTGEQKMADLPISRITPDEPPFTRVGMDFFGPFEVKQGRSMVKRYGVIFTCFAIRAVHLEVAHAMDTDSCINALRRFISRRGQVTEIWSDNGTNLVATNRELKQSIKQWNEAKIRQEMLQVNIDWKFSPPTGSHYGGIWERQIRTVRQILNVLLRLQSLTDESLLTFMCEVEMTINSRPLTTMSFDPNDVEPLTPNHLLLLKGKPNLPPGTFVKTDNYPRRRWRQVQFLADLFWKRWLREYLPQLQQRQKWLKPMRDFAIGDIVLVMDDNAPRNSWSMGRISSVMPDTNGEVRRVKVKIASRELERPIAKLCLLLEADQ